MPRKEHDLFDAIASFPALHAAALRAATGKRGKPGVAAFLANLETEVLRLERELLSGRYAPGRYKTIEILDPKHRIVSAAPFRDRVVHHAFCGACEPLFERGFIHDSYANRKGKGTPHGPCPVTSASGTATATYCAATSSATSRPSTTKPSSATSAGASPAPGLLRSRSASWTAPTPRSRSTSTTPAMTCSPPFERRRGLPIGNLTSQFFANLYLDGLDHFVKEVLRAKGYLRYVDDFAPLPR